MSLLTPESVGKLQTALHVKAKESPGFRFYALYDKMYRTDVLWHAYRICQINGGAPGVDGQTFENIKECGKIRWLRELAEGLQTKSYRPEAVRRVLNHARQRLRQWLRRKHKVPGWGYSRFPDVAEASKRSAQSDCRPW